MPRFTVLREGRIERSVELGLDEVTIGRLPGSHLELPQPSVSRRHARIRRDGQGWILEDAGSTNGVMVGSSRVRRHELRCGERIVIEDFEIVFEPEPRLFEAGLKAAPSDSGAHSFSMTYVSARSFTASRRPA